MKSLIIDVPVRGWSLARSIKLATVLAVGAAGMVAAAAQARAADSDSRSITVSVRDLDLSTTRGQETLRRRVKWAADIVCGLPDSRDLRLLSEYRNCVDEATNTALAQAKVPQLAQVKIPRVQ
jgi:UrcA family protein